MPEGDTIRAIADDFVPHVGQWMRVTSPQGRSADFPRMIGRRKLTAVDTHGKHLFLSFGVDQWLHIHLGMYGRVHWQEATAPADPVGMVRVRLRFPEWTADLNGPTVCKSVSSTQKLAIHTRLGIDPLVEGESFDAILPWLLETRTAVGAVLLMQAIFAGVGNVYRSELPFMLRLNPYTPSRDVPEATWRELWAELVRIMRDSVDNHHGRRRTTTPDVKPRHWVYAKVGRPCLVCGTTIERQTQAGRNLFYCPTCQGVEG